MPLLKLQKKTEKKKKRKKKKWSGFLFGDSNSITNQSIAPEHAWRENVIPIFYNFVGEQQKSLYANMQTDQIILNINLLISRGKNEKENLQQSTTLFVEPRPVQEIDWTFEPHEILNWLNLDSSKKWTHPREILS